MGIDLSSARSADWSYYAVEAEGGVTVVDVWAHAMEEAVFYLFEICY